jgi:hypothetical protein
MVVWRSPSSHASLFVLAPACQAVLLRRSFNEDENFSSARPPSRLGGTTEDGKAGHLKPPLNPASHPDSGQIIRLNTRLEVFA